VQLQLVIRALHQTLQRVDLRAKKSGHQMAHQLTHLPLQHLVNRTLVNQQQDSQMLDNQTPVSQPLDNQTRDSQMLGNQHNKVQLSTRMKLLAATQTTMEFLTRST
jgi:hypothetical protein